MLATDPPGIERVLQCGQAFDELGAAHHSFRVAQVRPCRVGQVLLRERRHLTQRPRQSYLTRLDPRLQAARFACSSLESNTISAGSIDHSHPLHQPMNVAHIHTPHSPKRVSHGSLTTFVEDTLPPIGSSSGTDGERGSAVRSVRCSQRGPRLMRECELRDCVGELVGLLGVGDVTAVEDEKLGIRQRVGDDLGHST